MLNNSFTGSEKPFNIIDKINIDQEMKDDTNILSL